MVKNIVFLPGWSFKPAIWQRQEDYFLRLGYNIILCDLEELERCLEKIRFQYNIFIAWSLAWFRLIKVLEGMQYLPKAIVGVASAIKFKKSLLRLIIQRFHRDSHQLLDDFTSWLFAASEMNSEILSRERDFISKNRIDDDARLLTDLLFLEHVDLSSCLSRFHIPILLISGKEDIIIPVHETIKLKETLPRAEMHIINSGHIPFLTQVDEFNEAVNVYITKL